MQAFVQSLSIKKQIGQGGFGKIYLGQSSEDGTSYAVKTISKASGQSHNIEREACAGNALQHKNITNFICHFEDENNDYLIYDYIQGKPKQIDKILYKSGSDMFSLLEKRNFKPFTETEAKSIFRQTLNAIDYCHQNGIVHFDVKLDNLMIDPTTQKVTLIDFGLCDFITRENNGKFSRRVGSEEYCAPELLEKSQTPFDGTKVDIFCLGVVLFAMLSATFPFDIKKRKMAVRQGLAQPAVRFPFAVSNECKDLITKMLEQNPAKRITIEQIFEHPWLCQMNKL